jgi:exportin-5
MCCGALTDPLYSSHRATRLDAQTRVQRLRAFTDPVKSLWDNAGLKQALGSYAGFCELLGLDRAQKYIAQRRMHEVGDWGSVGLDAEGLALQEGLEERQAVRISPLRLVTKRHVF